MTERATLEALLARVLESTGPDRELDAEIARMQLPPDADAVTRSRHGWSYRVFGPDGWDDEWLENKPYTASLDAALTLVPEGWSWYSAMRHYLAPVGAAGSVWQAGQPRATFTADAATPARALIAACLKARMEAQPSGNSGSFTSALLPRAFSQRFSDHPGQASPAPTRIGCRS